jgi:phosphoheptose isomerase
MRLFHWQTPVSSEESALVKSTQDKNLDVSRQAAETLIGLCRSGHEEKVVRAFARAISRQPRLVQKIVATGDAFKIPDRAEEQRVQDILNNGH